MMGVTGYNTSNSTWLFDGDASHHITNDLNALSFHTPYDGNEELIISDGSSLTITHIGSLNISFSNPTFTLQNVFVFPHFHATLFLSHVYVSKTTY